MNPDAAGVVDVTPHRDEGAEFAPAGNIELACVGLSKRFDVQAVDSFDLEVAAGEFVALLGPSGCGKTTTLRMAAGFIEPDVGHILIRGRDVTKQPPNKRDIGMVFQSYGLLPHMTVADNVAYGLKARRVAREERRTRVRETLEMVHLGDVADRYPNQLSGGQQQRVALARAVVIRPSVLLLDEPLSNLDASLREEMRGEIWRLQRALQITTVVVTHDQEEALALADRIVVMNHGRIEQIGTPHAIYHEPHTPFVASFIGDCNFWEGTIAGRNGGEVAFDTSSGLRLLVADPCDHAVGEQAVVSLRPETVVLFEVGDETSSRFANAVPGTLSEVTYLGARTDYRVRIDDGTSLRVTRQNAGDASTDPSLVAGDAVTVAWQPSSARVIRSSLT